MVKITASQCDRHVIKFYQTHDSNMFPLQMKMRDLSIDGLVERVFGHGFRKRIVMILFLAHFIHPLRIRCATEI